MSRRTDFLQLVQTAAIVQDVVMHGQRKLRDSIDIMARAQQIDESALPNDLAQATRDFVVYAYGGADGPPDWYLEWMETAGGEW